VASLVSHLLGRFAEQSGEIENAATRADERVDAASDRLAAEIESKLGLIGEAADAAADRLSGTLDGAGGSIEQALAKLREHERALDGRVESQREMLQRAIADAEKANATLDSNLAARKSSLRQTAEDADSRVQALMERLGGLADRVNEVAARGLTEYLSRIATANEAATIEGEKLRKALSGQVEAVDTAMQRMAGLRGEIEAASDRLRLDAEGLAEAWRKTTDDAAALGQALKSQSDDVASVSATASTALREALVDIESRFRSIDATVTDLIERVATATESHAAEITKIAKATDAGRDRVRAAGMALADQSSKLTLVAFGAARAQQQVGSAVRKLALQVDDLTASGEGRMADLARSLKRAKQELAQSAEAAVKQSESISETFRGDAEKLVEIAQKAGVQAAAVKGVVREHLEELGELSGRVGQLVQVVREGLKGQAEQFKAVASGARADTTAIREELAQQAQTLMEAADKVAELLGQVGSAVDSKAERLMTAADHAVRRSTEIAGTFDGQARLLTEAVDGAAGKMEELGARFEDRRAALSAASEKTEAQLVALEKARSGATRDSFLRSAKAMMDELNGLALDINTLFESDVPEDVWRGYNKGDRSIFARRLFKTRDSYIVPAIEQRYDGDPKFRELVTRYMNTFEDMLSKANEIEPEGTLSATFITADVGKLYLVLSRSLGRSAH
jgi:ABC-type transporter Mla subunit MlaD